VTLADFWLSWLVPLVFLAPGLIKPGEVGDFFNEIAQFLSKSEVLVALSVFSSPYFFHQ
jgi:hypothetical protein